MFIFMMFQKKISNFIIYATSGHVSFPMINTLVTIISLFMRIVKPMIHGIFIIRIYKQIGKTDTSIFSIYCFIVINRPLRTQKNHDVAAAVFVLAILLVDPVTPVVGVVTVMVL